ncbi:MAG: hypothetical protein KDH96_11015, partial [Candidatus Riesia sp.]|nr:hypothetical protein [Candidatus Riesia sp.]
GSGAVGSGDVAQNLLPVSMKIAAQTIGLDLVAVKPTASPRIELLFVDFKYDNNDEDANDRPLVFKVGSSTAADITTLKAGLNAQLSVLSIQERIGGLDSRTFVKLGSATATPAEIVAFTGSASDVKTGWLEFLGFSRVDGYPMFRSFRQVYPQVDVQYVPNTFDATKNTFAQVGSIADVFAASGITHLSGSTSASGSTGTFAGTADVELVSLMEDHIPGFSAGWNLYDPMTRAVDEKTYPGVIGPDVFTKAIQVGDVEISSALKRTQIEDIKAATGMDIVQKLEGVLINELTQVISKEIVAKIRELALTNRSSHTAPKDGSGVSKFDFNVDTYLTIPASGGFSAPGGETYHSLQRKLVAKINNASNFIATDGRVGPAQYLVTNGNLASVIQDIAGYTISPVQAGKLNQNGQLYPMGNLGPISIYVDPYMRWDDNQIFLGRKNSVDQPGLIFVPYLMAQSISLISEATWAPRMLIRSRYAVADVGFFPEKQFMAISVTDSNGVLI